MLIKMEMESGPRPADDYRLWGLFLGSGLRARAVVWGPGPMNGDAYNQLIKCIRSVLPGPAKGSLPLQPKTTAILAPFTATFHICYCLHAF
jgi:hypothetical protein